MFAKKILPVVFASLISHIAFSQVELGFSGGLNLSNSRDLINDNTVTHFYLSRPNLGADFNYYFDENWGLQTGLYFAGKGWRVQHPLGFDTIVVRLNYLELPLKASYRFKDEKEKNITVSGGLYAAFGISGKTTFRNTPQLTYDPFKRKNYKRFDLGYVIESGYRIKNNYGARLSYTHGLLSLERPDDKLKNFLFSVSFFVIIK